MWLKSLTELSRIYLIVCLTDANFSRKWEWHQVSLSSVFSCDCQNIFHVFNFLPMRDMLFLHLSVLERLFFKIISAFLKTNTLLKPLITNSRLNYINPIIRIITLKEIMQIYFMIFYPSRSHIVKGNSFWKSSMFSQIRKILISFPRASFIISSLFYDRWRDQYCIFFVLMS